MPQKLSNLAHCLALIALLISACQLTPAATPLPPTATEKPAPTATSITVVPTATPTTPSPPAPTPIPNISFADSGQEIGSGPANDVALGDLDNDGDLDAFIAYGQWDRAAPNKVFLNDGGAPGGTLGHFSDSGQELGMKKSFTVNLGDFDQDGDLDAFISNGDYDAGDENEIWFNQGDGQFELNQSIGKTNGMALVGDLNGDGYLDAFLCNHILSDGSNGGHRVYLNDGGAPGGTPGQFTDSGQILGGRQESRLGDLGDIDGDGDLDVIVGTYASGTEVWLNDGSGRFTQDAQILGQQESRQVALGDLDGNGSLDAFVTYFRYPNRVWLNTLTDRMSHFETTEQLIGEEKNSGVNLADLDGDGDLDAFVINSAWQENWPNTVWENDGQGNFTDTGLRLGNDEGQGVALGDLDGDGKPDAFVANRTTPSRVYFNRSKGESAVQAADYLGQAPPGSTPLLFAPGVISVEGKNDHTLSFSPDGQEVYFTRDPERVTMFMRYENGQWTEPQVAPFQGREALFSPDGQRLFFNDGDLWFVERAAGGWSEPHNLGAPVNSSDHDYYASVTRDGTLYFSRIVDDHARIFRSLLVDGRYVEIEELGAPVNDASNNYHPFIAPDESYLLFNSIRPGGFGGPDLYVSFRRDDATWTEPANLGEPINSGDGDLCPVVSPGGKYLFFTRFRDGLGDIYWVGSVVIEQLRARGR